MLSHPYIRAVAVLLLTFVSTCAFVLALWMLLQLLALPTQPIPVGIGLYAVTVIFAATSVRYFAKALLFEAQDRSPLQMVGGVRFGTFLQAVARGRGATWPFAKLSASSDAIRLQSPFGTHIWVKTDTRMVLRQTASRSLLIGADAEPVLFIALPWQRGRLVQTLRELGYELETPT